jgi:hypothetical protein
MGWTGSYEWKTKEEAVAEEMALGPGWSHLIEPVWHKEYDEYYEHDEYKEWVCWMALRAPSGEGLIVAVVAKPGKGRGGKVFWMVKSMDETVGPYYYSVPSKFLKLATPAPVGGYSEKWRAEVAKAQG